MSKISRLPQDKYAARVELLKYSITFAGAAVAFVITAIEKLSVRLEPTKLKWLLASWGLVIFTGFVMYVLSYRETWYYPRIGDRWSWAEKLERYTLYVALFMHPLLMLFAAGSTVYVLWKVT